eukprot:TRINITY_DN8453_c0_g2_i5.p1 TRINITY_DN8453_c0_g2~~TRINITY_DN8453_c0_g2_i5.p1  ORF type:complete len:652 (+),score=82.68 TRINITY_DN8453_c0_g2_i5:89-2044(+)
MGALHWCYACRSALSRPAFSPDDSAEDRQRKEFLMPIAFATVLLCAAAYVVSPDFPKATSVLRVGLLVSITTNSLFAATARYCSGLRLRRWIGAQLVVMVLAVILIDWGNSAYGTFRSWGLVIVLVDISLVCDVESRFVAFVLFLLAVWLAVERVESAILFGLYDSSDWGEGDRVVHWCNCPDPPCALPVQDAVVNYVGSQLFVFFADFFLTRGFAKGMQQQVALVTASVAVCTSVATMLSRYEVSAASELVDGPQGATLPPEMRSAFCVLLQNLDSYRPYLPQSCLPAADEDEQTMSDTCSDVPSTAARGEVALRTRELSDASEPVSRFSAGSDLSTRSSSTTSSSPATVRPQASGALRAEPRSLQVALLCTNCRGFLSVTDLQQPTSLAEWMAHHVGVLLNSVGKGVVDLVNGDHCFVSFGASRPCSNRRVAAARCAWSYSEPARAVQDEAGLSSAGLDIRQKEHGALAVTSTVISGVALCGDFGTASLLRFMTVGGTYCLLQAADRVAAQRGTRVLVDASTHGDVAATFRCRLVSAVRYAKRGSVHPVFLWEALEPAPESNTEWMYAMEQEEIWKCYNEAMMLWLRSGATDATRRAASAAARAGNVDVAAAGAKLLASVQAACSKGGAAPPQHHIVETGLQEMSSGPA